MSLRLPPAFAHADFRRFLVARLLANFGAQMVVVAVGYQVYQLTHSPFDLGLIGLSQFLPFLVLALPAGQAADRLDRRRIIGACYAILAACEVALTAFALAGLTSPTPIFAVLTVFGATRAFNMPTQQALLPNLVPVEEFGGAVAVNSSTMQISTIAGPAVGGLVFLAGPWVVYASVAVLMAMAALLMFRISTGRRRLAVHETRSLGTLLSGITFVRSRPVVLGSISLDLFAVLFGGAEALLPAYATDILHVGPTGLGLLRAAPAVGAGLCGVVLAAWPVRRQVGRFMFAGVAAFGLATIVFALSSSFVLSLAALVVMGAGDMVSMYIRHLLVQLTTPDQIRGRVSAVNAVFIGASNELGEFESGVTAAWWGTVPAVFIGGIATVLVAATWSGLFPSLRRLDRFPGAATETDRTEARSSAFGEVGGGEPGLDAPTVGTGPPE